MLVDLLACGVAAGLARQAQEKAAVQAQVRFEQFFGPDLARRLLREPNLLDSREATVTLLFCDVRGFSRVSEKLGPAETLRWMNDVLSELSQCVFQEKGVLVDYVGDELLAMWGAPEDQPDQAERAARAALAMLAGLPALNARWQEVAGEPTEVGIGISTGPAQVGNTGSRLKFKYGALGNTVNLASRVQGATKYLKATALLTEATRAHLDESFATRRLCQVRVVNIDTPVTLYELAPPDRLDCGGWKEQYEAGLRYFDVGNFRQSARTLQPLIVEEVNDGPAIVLIARAIQGLANGATPDHPVWELPTK